MKGRQRNMAIRSGINRQGWEKSDFPVACEKCYGQNPYMRMLKQDYGQECRICFRPFTVFKWKGDRGIYKRTCVCQSCSKEKNICQVCTLDLQFNLPIDIRDKRCGKNGKYLLDENFTNVENTKFKPPPPPGPPPQLKQSSQTKQLVYVPQKDSDDDEKDQQPKIECKAQNKQTCNNNKDNDGDKKSEDDIQHKKEDQFEQKRQQKSQQVEKN